MVNSLLLATVIRTALVVISYGCKVPAGIFVPSMAVGATFGRMIGILVKALYRCARLQQSLLCLSLTNNSFCAAPIRPGASSLLATPTSRASRRALMRSWVQQPVLRMSVRRVIANYSTDSVHMQRHHADHGHCRRHHVRAHRRANLHLAYNGTHRDVHARARMSRLTSS